MTKAGILSKLKLKLVTRKAPDFPWKCLKPKVKLTRMGDVTRRIIKEELTASARLKELLAQGRVEEIYQAASLLIGALKGGGKIVAFGNGGSACDAQHLAAELVGRFRNSRKAFPALALSSDAALLTCLGNDFGYEQVFSRQIEALVRKTDAVVAISTSGNSPNVIAGVKASKQTGAKVVGLLGKDGGRVKSLVDVAILVPSDETPRIQEGHTTIIHILCRLIEENLLSLPGKGGQDRKGLK